MLINLGFSKPYKILDFINLRLHFLIIVFIF
jgi:hypothetical protein